MKRFRLIAFIIGVLVASIVIFAKIQRGPRSLAKIHTGIDIPRDYKLSVFEDDWHINGDGRTLIIFSMSDIQILELEKKLIILDYISLPIEEELPDNSIYNHLDRQSSNGVYFIQWEGQYERDYKLIVLDKKEKRLLIYYVLT